MLDFFTRFVAEFEMKYSKIILATRHFCSQSWSELPERSLRSCIQNEVMGEERSRKRSSTTYIPLRQVLSLSKEYFRLLFPRTFGYLEKIKK